jgi:class 3 adenylate cyclase/tetratricopeptide (TPR) repeat protein
MTFEEILDHAIAMLQRRGRLTYGTLKRQFQLDDATLEDLKNELIEGQRLAVDERGNVLVWTGAEVSAPYPTTPPASSQDRPPLAYTPQYLAEKVLHSRSAMEGERKQVTVLFADLKSSMELLADRDPEEARHILDPVLERLMAAVHRYEGTVNQIMGDGIMALFGAPLAHEDHAVRACYAALAMQEAIRRYSAEVRRTHGIEVQIRVGLNSGEVVVRAIGNDLHMDYSAIGQTTHMAARMEQLATPGSIRLTAETLRLAEGLVQVTSLGPVPVRGLADPVEVFELVGASTLRGRFQAAATRGLTRFVGRQMELEALQKALARAETGLGHIVAMVGEAGVGKSRLVYEFVHSHRLTGWRVLESASVSYGKATPYFPVLDLLKRYVHVEESDDLRTIRAKVTGQVLTLDEAETLARALDDRAQLVRVLALKVSTLNMTGDSDGAIATGRQALALAAALGDGALQGQASFYLGLIYYFLGDFGRAAELLRWNVEATERASGTPSTEVRIESRAWLARTLSALGAFAEGRRHGEEALRLATLEGRAQTPIIAHGCLGCLYLAQGDLEHAIRVLDQGLALCRAAGDRNWLQPIAADLGFASVLQGRLAEGRVLVEEAIRENIRTGALGYRSRLVAQLSEVCRLAGHGEAAGQHACQALDLARQQKERGYEALALHQIGVVQAHADPPDVAQSEAHYHQSLALADELGMRPLQAHCHLGLGTLYATTGQHEQARAELSAAIELYRGMEMRFWLPQAEATLAQVR